MALSVQWRRTERHPSQTSNIGNLIPWVQQTGTTEQGGMMQGGMMGREMMGGYMMGRGMMGRGAMGPPFMMRMMFALIDADSDGTVSLEEFQAAHERIFKAMDTNKDGKLTLEEMQAFMHGTR
jgi:hypothetical protein